MKDGKRTGIWIHYYSNGDKYEGEFKDNERDGLGVYWYKEDGWRYEGNWKRGLKEGVGIMYDAYGNIQQAGIWTDYKFQG